MFRALLEPCPRSSGGLSLQFFANMRSLSESSSPVRFLFDLVWADEEDADDDDDAAAVDDDDDDEDEDEDDDDDDDEYDEPADPFLRHPLPVLHSVSSAHSLSF